MRKVTCPCCKGDGKVEPRILQKIEEKRRLAKKMRSIGMSYSQIMRALGYKSPHSISQALGK